MEVYNIPIHQIVALDEKGGIGLGGTLPWNLKKEWEHFLRMTTQVKVQAFKW
jgi:dihydrofolate reductase